MDFTINHIERQATRTATEKEKEVSDDEDDGFKRFDKIINEYANLQSKLNNQKGRNTHAKKQMQRKESVMVDDRIISQEEILNNLQSNQVLEECKFYYNQTDKHFELKGLAEISTYQELKQLIKNQKASLDIDFGVLFGNQEAKEELQQIKASPKIDQTLFDVEQDKFIIENQVKDNVAESMTALYKSEYRRIFDYNSETHYPNNMTRYKLKLPNCVEQSLFFYSYGNYLYITIQCRLSASENNGHMILINQFNRENQTLKEIHRDQLIINKYNVHTLSSKCKMHSTYQEALYYFKIENEIGTTDLRWKLMKFNFDKGLVEVMTEGWLYKKNLQYAKNKLSFFVNGITFQSSMQYGDPKQDIQVDQTELSHYEWINQQHVIINYQKSEEQTPLKLKNEYIFRVLGRMNNISGGLHDLDGDYMADGFQQEFLYWKTEDFKGDHEDHLCPDKDWFCIQDDGEFYGYKFYNFIDKQQTDIKEIKNSKYRDAFQDYKKEKQVIKFDKINDGKTVIMSQDILENEETKLHSFLGFREPLTDMVIINQDDQIMRYFMIDSQISDTLIYCYGYLGKNEQFIKDHNDKDFSPLNQLMSKGKIYGRQCYFQLDPYFHNLAIRSDNKVVDSEIKLKESELNQMNVVKLDYNTKENDDYADSTRFQYFNDNRRVWPRLIKTSGRGADLLDLRDRHGVSLIDPIHVTNSEHTVLNQSSSIQLIDSKLLTFKQNFQISFKKQKKDFVYFIDEYEIEWSEDENVKPKVKLIGQKILLLVEKQDLWHIPLLQGNSNYLIKGAQYIFKNDKNMEIRLQMKNSEGFQFKNGVMNCGYQIYNDPSNLSMFALLIQARVSDKIIDNDVLQLTHTQRLILLEKQIKVILNMATFNPFDQLTSVSKIDDEFMPLMLLNGNSMADLFLTNPDKITEITTRKEGQKPPLNCQKSLIQILEANMDQKNYQELENNLIGDGNKKDWIKENYKMWNDLCNSNPMHRCFLFENIENTYFSCTALIKSILNDKNSKNNYDWIFYLMPYLLASDSYFKDFADFITESHDEKPDTVKFAYRLDSEKLSAFSDKTIFLREVKGGNCQLRQDIHQTSIDHIIEEFKPGSGKAAKKDILVEHFLINCHNMISQIKVNEIIRPKSNKMTFKFDQQFTEFHFMEIIFGLNDKYYLNVEDQVTFRAVIDYIWQTKTQKFYYRILTMHLVFFVLPFFVQLFWISEPAIVLPLACCTICWIEQTILFILELIQLYHDGWKIYFGEHANKLDTLMYFTFSTYFYIRLQNPEVRLIPEDARPIADEHKQWFQIMVLLNTVVICQVFIKVQSLLMVNDDFGKLVKLFMTCIVDVIYFFLYFDLWMVAFMLLFRVLGAYQSFEGAAKGYPDTSPVVVYASLVLENTVGNIFNPTYTYWDSFEHKEVFIYLIWIVWFYNQLIMLIILMNFLIAVITQSYENVMNKQMIHKYRRMCDLNRKCLLNYYYVGSLSDYDCLILSTKTEMEEEADEWKGFVQTLKKFITGQTKQIQTSQEDASQKIENITNSQNELQNNFKDEVKEFQKTLVLEVQGMKKEIVREVQSSITFEIEKLKQDQKEELTRIVYYIKKVRDEKRTDTSTRLDTEGSTKKKK